LPLGGAPDAITQQTTMADAPTPGATPTPTPTPTPPAAPAAPQQHQPARVGPWVLERQIGAGSFATVWRAVHEQTGQQAAVKAVETGRLGAKLRESLASEVAVLRATRHANVVRLLDLIQVRSREHVDVVACCCCCCCFCPFVGF
jgi:serine/threonine protein kinase